MPILLAFVVFHARTKPASSNHAAKEISEQICGISSNSQAELESKIATS